MAKDVSKIKFTKPVDFGNQTITNLTLTSESVSGVATNLENGGGTNSIQQKPENFNLDDGTAITAGATNEYAVSLTGKSAAAGKRALAHGTRVRANGDYSHAEGNNTLSEGKNSHAEGLQTQAVGNTTHAEGAQTVATGEGSHVEGVRTTATVTAHYAHAEGSDNIVGQKTEESSTPGAGEDSSSSQSSPETISPQTGFGAHAEGINNYAKGDYSHAEGTTNTAQAGYSHVEGFSNKTTGDVSHAEGTFNIASGYASHAEGNYTVASGRYSHSSGDHTTANAWAQTVVGAYNSNPAGALFIVGNGGAGTPSSAFAAYHDGHATVGAMGTDDLSVATKKYVDDNKGTSILPACNVDADGEYILKCSVVQDGYSTDKTEIVTVNVAVIENWTYLSSGKFEAVLEVQTPGLKNLDCLYASSLARDSSNKIDIINDSSLYGLRDGVDGHIEVSPSKEYITVFLHTTIQPSSGEQPSLTDVILEYTKYKPNWVRTYSWVKLDIE